jgi:metal-responsive CopG/Arc/MetJ family transcriptional regulator
MVTKTSISLPDDLAATLDRLSQERRMPRSALVREGLMYWLQEEQRQHILARARELYAEIAAEDRALAEMYQPLVGESLPPYYTANAASGKEGME